VEKTLGNLRPTSSQVVRTETRTRAGKFVRSMETSDAYRDYKKHGKSSKFNEFDVRSMLLCTMESPPETLKRNLDQFREYADVTSRKDLAAFLDFSEQKFSYLFALHKKPAVRKTKKTKGKK